MRVHIRVKNHKVTVGRRSIHLTRREFQIFCLIAAGRGNLVRREDILRAVWPHTAVCAVALDQHISSIRRKAGPRVVRTLHTLGYLMPGDISLNGC